MHEESEASCGIGIQLIDVYYRFRVHTQLYNTRTGLFTHKYVHVFIEKQVTHKENENEQLRYLSPVTIPFHQFWLLSATSELVISC